MTKSWESSLDSFQECPSKQHPSRRCFSSRKIPRLNTKSRLTDFKSSDSWLKKWIIRHNVAGEENRCTSEMTTSWKETNLATILFRYELKIFFNANKFGNFSKQP